MLMPDAIGYKWLQRMVLKRQRTNLKSWIGNSTMVLSLAQGLQRRIRLSAEKFMRKLWKDDLVQNMRWGMFCQTVCIVFL